jgi:hypothetical protein
LIHAAATFITLTLNEPSKRNKNRRNVKFWEISSGKYVLENKFWKIRMQKQISSRRKEVSKIAETGTNYYYYYYYYY